MSNSAHHKSRLFHKGCLSLHSCQTAILSHVGALNSAYWAFSTFQSALIWAIALVVLSSFSIWKDCDRKGIDFKTQKVEGKNIVGHGPLVQSVVDWIRVELSLSGPAWKHNRQDFACYMNVSNGCDSARTISQFSLADGFAIAYHPWFHRCNPRVNFANVKLVHSNLVCNLWILLAWHVSTPVFIANRR